MSGGWIKLHRKILDTPALQDWQARSVFIELLLRATHKPHTIDRKGRVVELQPGQLITTERLLADDLKLGRQVIRRILGLLKNRTMIETKTNPLGTVITICNWRKYQEDQPRTNPGPTQQPTQDQPRTNPHYKKEKNLKKESTDSESLPETIDQLALIAPVPRIDVDQVFEDWWHHWAMPGTKRGKGSARRKYRTLVKNGIEPQDLVDGLKRYMVHCHQNGTPIQFIKHPVTWLNSEGWKDELLGDQPDRRTANGFQRSLSRQMADLASDPDVAAQLAENERIIREAGLADDAAGAPERNGQAHVNGSGDQPDRQDRPRHGDQRDGEGVLEVPAWLDPDGDPGPTGGP